MPVRRRLHRKHLEEKEFPAGAEQIYQGLLQGSEREKPVAESSSVAVDGLDGPSGLIQLFPHAMGHSAPGANLNPQPPAGKPRAQVSSRAVALGQRDPHISGPPAWCQPGAPLCSHPRQAVRGCSHSLCPALGGQGQPDTAHGSRQTRPLQSAASSAPGSRGCPRALGSHPAGASSCPRANPCRICQQRHRSLPRPCSEEWLPPDGCKG